MSKQGGRRRRHAKRKLRYITYRDLESSAFQIRLKGALESGGGVRRATALVEGATDVEIEELNDARWTPLVVAAFRLGKNGTRNGNAPGTEDELLRLIRVCRERGLSPNSRDVFGGRVHRPLIVASYYGYHEAVRMLVEAGARPNARDGEGRDAWFAAFQNPVLSSPRGANRFRECDRLTAQTLLDMGVVTNDIRKGSTGRPLCYMNAWLKGVGSVMYNALRNHNSDVVQFLVDAGGVITDHDYLRVRRSGKEKLHLLPIVKELLLNHRTTTAAAGEAGASNNEVTLQDINSWNADVDWSFPPTWKVGVVLCQDCGLPSDIFRTNVVPFLGRDWFFD